MKLEFMIHSLDPVHVRHTQETKKQIISRICIDKKSSFYGNISGGSEGESIKRTDYEAVGWYEYICVRLA